ncbi:vacuolar fusion protein ccz1 [Tritrichomonas musculus]|uniref:Vacuolar fusion protein ccz1 n=1 Tax=Tritrichomonas musculus TaxID=1915356 RepID=A0ABR2IZY3_9EUKA
MISTNLPPLISFAVYDGIPPKEEGMDPTVFWYWPNDTPIDVQLNQIGLYLTFTGFCRDFRSSKDCEYIQTDYSFTCFDNIGADVCLAACFKTTDPDYYRILMKLLHVFRSVCLMLCTSPVRTKNGDVENLPNLIQFINEFLVIFRYIPILNSFPPNIDLWIKCEELIANMKGKFPTIIGAAITYKDYIVHSSINQEDLLSLYISCKANFKMLTEFAPLEKPKDQFVWLVGISGGYSQKPLVFCPRITLSDTSSGYPIIVLYNELLVFVIFSSQLNKKTQDDMPELKNILEAVLDNIEKECLRMENMDLTKNPSITLTLKSSNQRSTSLISRKSNEQNFYSSTTNLNLKLTNDKRQSQKYDNSIYLIPTVRPIPSDSILYNSVNQSRSGLNPISSSSYQIPSTKLTPLTKQKSSKNKSSNQQQAISLYRDDGFKKYITNQASQSLNSNYFYDRFSFQTVNEKMIHFLNNNDNQTVRFCGLQDNGTYIFMEKIGNSSTFMDGLNSNLKDATSDYLKFMKDS